MDEVLKSVKVQQTDSEITSYARVSKASKELANLTKRIKHTTMLAKKYKSWISPRGTCAYLNLFEAMMQTRN